MEKPCSIAISARFVEDDGENSREDRHPRVRMQEGDVRLFEKRGIGVPKIGAPYPANAHFPPLPLRRSWLSFKNLFGGKDVSLPLIALLSLNTHVVRDGEGLNVLVNLASL